MKSPICFFALLLLVSTAAPSLAGGASASPPPAAVRSVAGSSPACLAGGQGMPASTEQNVPVWLAAIQFPPPPRPKCGRCSSWDCAGITLYTQCANGKPYSGVVCVDIGICTADGSLQCDCRPAQ